MKVISLIPRGYCKGVVNAINIAKKCVIDYPNTPITVLGMIVHNDYVVQALNQLNIKTIDSKNKTRLELLDEVNEGVVLFTAHGISDDVITKAREKGLIAIDASCSDVITTKNKVKEKIAQNYHVLYIGKKGHPEAEAVLSVSEHVYLINDIDALHSYENNHPKLYVTTQTTMSILEVSKLIEEIQKKFPNVLVEEEICNATRLRQEAVLNSEDVDLLYVVGDPHSNNSNKLKSIALEKGIQQVELIETALDIKEVDLMNKSTVAVTAGASTPTYLTNQAITMLQNYANTNQFVYPKIEIKEILY